METVCHRHNAAYRRAGLGEIRGWSVKKKEHWFPIFVYVMGLILFVYFFAIY